MHNCVYARSLGAARAGVDFPFMENVAEWDAHRVEGIDGKVP